MFNRYSNIAVLFVILLFALSCIKKKEYDSVPAIKFIDFPVFYHVENSKNMADSAHVILSFTDGDGDIGNTNDAVMSLFLDYYEDEGSGFVFKNVTYKIHLPNLAPEGNNMAIEGTIQQLLKAPFYNEFSVFPYKFKMYLVDRAGNKSNVVETGSLSK
jgi:hypothetical protein